MIRRRGVDGRVPAFQPGAAARVRFPGRGGSGMLISVLGLGVSCVFCPVFVFGGGPDIVLTTHSGRTALVYLSSVLIQSLLLPLQASDPREFGFKSLEV